MVRHKDDIRKHAVVIESGKELESLDLRHEADAKEHGDLKNEHRSMRAIHEDVMSIVARIETSREAFAAEDQVAADKRPILSAIGAG